MENIEEILISCVENYPHLYNKRDVNYTNEGIKNNSWVQIAEHLSTDADWVKRKWANLRDRFVRAYRAQTETLPSGSRAIKKVNKFQHYDVMMWMIPHIRKRKMTSSCPMSPCEDPLAETECPISVMIDPSLSIDIPTDEESDYTVKRQGIVSPFSSSMSNPSSRIRNSAGKKLVEENFNTTTPSTLHNFLKKKIEKTSTQGSEADMDFMRSVANDMKLLTPVKKIKFKRDVMNLLVSYVENNENE